jgi:hypothetical protein
MFTTLKARFDNLYVALTNVKDYNPRAHNWHVIQPLSVLEETYQDTEDYLIDLQKESQVVVLKQYTDAFALVSEEGILYSYLCTNGKRLFGSTVCRSLDKFINAINEFCVDLQMKSLRDKPTDSISSKLNVRYSAERNFS